MFKGDRVICINLDLSVSRFEGDIFLTFGKTYILHEVFITPLFSSGTPNISNIKNMVFILDDRNRCSWYNADRFISIKEYRKQKLEKLCLM